MLPEELLGGNDVHPFKKQYPVEMIHFVLDDASKVPFRGH